MIADCLQVSETSVRRWWNRWDSRVISVRRHVSMWSGNKWNIYDREKDQYLGVENGLIKGYPTEKAAEEALYQFL